MDNNKQIATNFVNDVLMGKAPEKITSYFDGNRYIQHNPAIANGLDGLGAALKWMAENDIFRLKNGKIVEHWDNIQTIPTDGQWANPNGKFGF